MDLSELSTIHNIPLLRLIDFFSAHNQDVDTYNPLTEEQITLFNSQVDLIKEDMKNEQNPPEKVRIEIPKLQGPKILSKIDLTAIDRTTRPRKVDESAAQHEGGVTKYNQTEDYTHHLVVIAAELKVSIEELKDFLVGEGFRKDELKTTSKISQPIYERIKKHFREAGTSETRLVLGKGLVCLKIGIDTFVRVFKENGEAHNLIPTKTPLQPRSISLQPEAYVSILKNDIVLKQIPDLKMVKVLKLDGFETTMLVEPFSFNQWDYVRASLYKSGQYSNISLPPLPFTEFASAFNFNHDMLRQRLKDNGYEYFYESWNISQKVPLQTFLKYLEFEKMPQEPFLECILSERQRRVSIPTEIITPEKETKKIDPPIKKRSMHFQKILFGSPGTGKSHAIDGSENSYLNQLGIVNKSLDCIKTVFHPEYTYGDFMGKLMPNTNDDGGVEYRFYAGHFLKTLGRAYKNIIVAKIEHEKAKDEVEKAYKREINKSNKRDFTDQETEELLKRRDSVTAPVPQNVALVIDEINRGNSAAIFGTTFQLLDRDVNGWSSYHVRISDLENNKLLEEITLEYKEYKKGNRIDKVSYSFDSSECSETEYNRYLDFVFEDLSEYERVSLTRRDIKLPPNLSIIATMNTSDNSIYFMDSAFKRRWDWEFIDITSDGQKQKQSGRKLEDGFAWDEFVDNLNSFIKKYGERIRKIEDKQIGYYFIKGDIIRHEAIKNKLMFFLWDSIFNNDKKPLKELIGLDKTLVTFGDFIRHYEIFISAIKNKSFSPTNVL